MTTPSGSVVDYDRLRETAHASVAAEVAAGNGGRPTVFPLTPFYDDERERVVVSSPPAYAGKVDHLKSDPDVLVNFYDGPEPLLVRGTATVRDEDVHANAEYVADLIRSEPDTEKRTAFERGGSFLESRLGRFLLDWYALRVVVEIDPAEVAPGFGTERAPRLPPWRAVGMDRTEADKHERVVLCGVVDGRPELAPVSGLDVHSDEATIYLPASVPLESGQPLCLLCHWHSPDVRKLGQRLVRGRCVGVGGETVRFRQASTFSMRQETALDFVRSVLRGKRRTRAYFEETNPLKWWW